MIRGHAEWKALGLQHPEEVLYAVKEWRGDEDYLGRFLGEKTQPTTNRNEFATKEELFRRFGTWADVTKEGEGLSDKQFTQMMRRKGFEDKPIKQMGKTIRVWLGLKYTGTLGNYSDGVSSMQVPEDGKL